MPGTRRLRWSIAAALFLCAAGFTWWRIPAENVSTLTVPWSRDRRVIGLSSDARWGISVRLESAADGKWVCRPPARLYDTAAGVETAELLDDFSTLEVQFSPEDSIVVLKTDIPKEPAQTSAFNASIFEIPSGKKITTLTAAADIRFSPDDRFFAFSGVSDKGPRQLRIWDRAKSEEILTLPNCSQLNFSPDGSRFACHFLEWNKATNDYIRKIIVYDLATATVEFSFDNHSNAVFSPDGRQLVLSGWRRQKQVLIHYDFGTKTERPVWEADSSDRSADYGTLSPDWRFRVRQPDGGPIILDESTSPLEKISFPERWLRRVEFSPDGAMALLTADDGLWLWNTHEEPDKRRLLIDGNVALNSPPVLRRDRSRIALVVTLWGRDSQASDEPSPWTGEWQQSLYGRNSNAANFRTEIVVWDVPSARRFCSIPSGSSPLFSPTDDRIYSTDSAGAIQVWNPVARKPWMTILPLWLGEALVLFLVALFWKTSRSARPDHDGTDRSFSNR